MNQNERRDMPIIIGLAIAAGLAVVFDVMWFGWPPS
jgi:hypothetical protein